MPADRYVLHVGLIFPSGATIFTRSSPQAWHDVVHAFTLAAEFYSNAIDVHANAEPVIDGSLWRWTLAPGEPDEPGEWVKPTVDLRILKSNGTLARRTDTAHG